MNVHGGWLALISRSRAGRMITARWCAYFSRGVRHASVVAGAVALLSGVCLQSVEAAQKSGPRPGGPVQAGPAGKGPKADLKVRARAPKATSRLRAEPPKASEPQAVSSGPPEPLKLPDSQLEPLAWSALEGWGADDHAAVFATFVASCRPLVRAAPAKGETRSMYFALKEACRRALAAGSLNGEPARQFFEENFRPVRIARLGDSTGLLTGYYEPIVDGSRFPTPIFKVPIYRRPPDLVPPRSATGTGFPNRGQSLRRTSSGQLKPYYDRGEIQDGALDGKYLEITWIKEHADLLAIQLQGSARIRLEDGVIVRLNYDGHNGYPFVPVSRILIDRKIIPRDEMSMPRLRAWMRENPEAAEKVRRQNRNFVFFKIVGLYDEHDGPGREALGAQGIPLTPERSLAVDSALHVYGTPFFIQAGLPLDGDRKPDPFSRLMIAQDTGSAMVGPARADIFWGAGEKAGQVAGRIRHPGSFAMLVPMDIDPVAAGRQMPMPPERPQSPVAEAIAQVPPQKAGDTRALPKPPIMAKSDSAPMPLPRPPIMARSESAPTQLPKPPIVARSESEPTPPPKPPVAGQGGQIKRAAVEKDRRGRSRPRKVTGYNSGW
jgi:membrane-bound lytic murein transglycosylase A